MNFIQLHTDSDQRVFARSILRHLNLRELLGELFQLFQYRANLPKLMQFVIVFPLDFSPVGFMQITLQAYHINNAQYARISEHSVSICLSLPSHLFACSLQFIVYCQYRLYSREVRLGLIFSLVLLLSPCVLSAQTHTHTHTHTHLISASK